MSGRALVFGGAPGELTGVGHDIETMTALLQERGMAVETLVGAQATRAGILAAYERLIAAVGPTEAAVVYYSGHGGRTRAPQPGTSGPALMDLQFIVPFDFDEAVSDDDFRGITSVELSILQTRLTQRTENVTVILDCCHSGRMSRDDRRVKSIPPIDYERLRAHIENLERTGGLRTGLLRSAGNKDAVRIVACAPEQSAFEYVGNDGRQIGLLTEALALALRAVGDDAVSWASVLDGVRARVLGLEPSQRPDVEGPVRRVVFTTEEDNPLDTLRVTDLGGGRLSLSCAALLGVRPADTFEVLTASGEQIGDLTVDRAGPFTAEGPVILAAGVDRVPVGSRARRLTAAAPILAVALPDAWERRDDLVQALKTAPMMRVAAEGEPWAVQVRVDPDGSLSLADRRGPLTAPRPGDATGTSRIVKDLETLARVAALRGLTAETRWSLGAEVAYEWGLVRAGRRQPLPEAGATVNVDDPVYIAVRNDGADTVYAALVDIGISGRVTLLTDFSPEGVRLAKGQEYVFGFDDYTGVLDGSTVSWPDGMAPEHARPETVLLFVTSGPSDFSALMQNGIPKRTGLAQSPLEAVLAQISTGRTRDLNNRRGPATRYDVRALDFEVGTTEFLIEDRPADTPAGMTPRSTAPTAVAVRIDELVVHRNRAVFGAALRIDTIALTGSADSGPPVLSARTEHFHRIHDGEALPLDRMLVYHGPVRDYLDLAVWVSRDGGGPDLAELLGDEAASFEVQEALAKMSDTLTGATYAAGAAAAMGVGAVVATIAYKLLRGSVSNVIGLYRGSMLAREQFGVGRHPADGVRRVQDFSLAYTIDDVS